MRRHDLHAPDALQCDDQPEQNQGRNEHPLLVGALGRNLHARELEPGLEAELLRPAAEGDRAYGDLVAQHHHREAHLLQALARRPLFAKGQQHALLHGLALDRLTLDPRAHVGLRRLRLGHLHHFARRHVFEGRVEHVPPVAGTEQREGDEQQRYRLVPAASHEEETLRGRGEDQHGHRRADDGEHQMKGGVDADHRAAAY